MIGAANRDERKYTDPDRFDMFRDQRQHVGFGFGVHVCLGMHLARMESRVALNTLFDRLGPFALDPEAEPPHIEGMAFRSPLSLPVVFARVGGSRFGPWAAHLTALTEASRWKSRSTLTAAWVRATACSGRPTPSI